MFENIHPVVAGSVITLNETNDSRQLKLYKKGLFLSVDFGTKNYDMILRSAALIIYELGILFPVFKLQKCVNFILFIVSHFL